LVTIAESDYANPGKEIFDTPVDMKTMTGPDEFSDGARLAEAYMNNRAINLHDPRDNKLDPSEFTGDMETELIDNLDLTLEEKLGLIDLLNTLTDGYEPGPP
jgi:hypothetical protein